MKNLPYRIVTGIVAFGIFGSGLYDVMASKEIIEAMARLGYPKYFVILIGIWKMLGALAISLPGFARVKEWAYAGIMFDLTGALVSHIVAGDPVAHFAPVIVLIGLTVASYVLRMRSRSDQAPAPARPAFA